LSAVSGAISAWRYGGWAAIFGALMSAFAGLAALRRRDIG
jgi:hypothetical protein